MHVLFYIKRHKASKSKKVPIFLRITIGGKRGEISLKRSIKPNIWDSSRQSVIGKNPEAFSINEQIRLFRNLAYSKYNRLLECGEALSVEAIKNAVTGENSVKPLLSYAITTHNKLVYDQIGNGYALGTFKRFKTLERLLKDFLDQKQNLSDIPLENIDYAFLESFNIFLRVDRNCSNNTASKYLSNFRKIINLALKNEWIQKDPFRFFTAKLEEVERVVLTEEEIESIRFKQFDNARLQRVKDIFVFCCFTGLAYADVSKLSKENIVIGIDSNKWIEINRTKTKSKARIPLLPEALEILDKYQTDPFCIHKGVLLPVPSNQKLNAYLKEIAACCGITKELSSHIARHTFATTIGLNRGFSLEVVQFMLGHKSIKTTQHYAKMKETRIAEELKKVNQRENKLTSIKRLA